METDCPSKVIEELSLPWRNALIVKGLGKTLSFNVKKAKLSSIWKLIGGFEIMDIGNGFFMPNLTARRKETR